MNVPKVFMDGRNQFIRLPEGFRISPDLVFLKRTSEGLLIIERNPWELFAEGCRELSDRFMAERQPASPEKRN